MSERFPETPPAPEQSAPTLEQQEGADPEYESLVQTVRDLKAAGVKSLSKRTPETEAFHDALAKWREDREIGRLYVKTMEKARAFVRNARMLLDAGESGAKNKKDAAKFIREAFMAAVRDRVSEEIRNFLEDALAIVAGPETWTFSPDADVSGIEELPFEEAIPQINSILMHPDLYLRPFAPLKERVIAIRERLRAKRGMPPTPPYRPGPTSE